MPRRPKKSAISKADISRDSDGPLNKASGSSLSHHQTRRVTSQRCQHAASRQLQPSPSSPKPVHEPSTARKSSKRTTTQQEHRIDSGGKEAKETEIVIGISPISQHETSSDLETCTPESNRKSALDKSNVGGGTPEKTVLDGKTPEKKDLDGKTPEKKVLDRKTPEKKVLDGKSPEKKGLDGKSPEKKVLDGKTSEHAVKNDRITESVEREDRPSVKNGVTAISSAPGLATASRLGCRNVHQLSLLSTPALPKHQLEPSNPKLYSCDMCGRQYKRVDVLHNHKRRHTDDTRRCYICGEQSDDISSLVEHMKLHSITIVPYVSSAGYSFRSSAVVKSYRDLYRTGKSQPCYVCFTECSDPAVLLEHLDSHDMLELMKGSTDRNLWKSSTSYAQEEYNRWKELRRQNGKVKLVTLSKKKDASAHEYPTRNQYSHVCRVCFLMFKSFTPLLQHWLDKKGGRGHEGRVGKEGTDIHSISVSRHRAKAVLTCEECGGMNEKAEAAAEHHRSHHAKSESEISQDLLPGDTTAGGNRSRPVQNQNVKLIHKGLERNTALHSGQCEVSEETHSTGEKTCPICDANFDDDASYKDHLTVHKTDASFVCPLCGKLYSRPEDLKRHIVRHVSSLYVKGNAAKVGRYFQCTACSESFQDERGLQFHSVSHGVFSVQDKEHHWESTVCPICGKVLLKASSLTGHIQLHAQHKEFKCKICAHAFRSERNRLRHEKIHYGLKEFVCELCGKRLSRKAEYLAHVNRHQVNPDFNGKAGRKQGTKVIDKKVIYIKDIYLSPEERLARDTKAKNKQRRMESIKMDKHEQFLVLPPNTTIEQSLLEQINDGDYHDHTERSIISKRNKKRVTDLLSATDTAVIGDQTSGTQTEVLTAEQSLAHNIDIITSGMLDDVDVGPMDQSQDLEQEDVIIIVQDPNTGEKEILTIKSFQEGASKLVSPNDELMKALETFQKTTALTESVDESRVKTELLEGADDSEVVVKREVEALGEPVYFVQTDMDGAPLDQTIPACRAATQHSVQGSAMSGSTSTQESPEDEMPTSLSQKNNEYGQSDTGLAIKMPRTLIKTSPAVNVKVVAMTMDESTGKLIPISLGQGTPSGSQAVFVKSECSLGYELTDSPASCLTTFAEIKSERSSGHTDSDLSAVEALMQMKSTDHSLIIPPTSSGYLARVPSTQHGEENVRVLASTGNNETDMLSESGFGDQTLYVLPSSPMVVDDDQDDSGNDNMDEDDDVDDGLSGAKAKPRKRKACRGDNRSLLQPVRKSLRKNSYAGVARIVASLHGHKKVKREKSKPESEFEDEDGRTQAPKSPSESRTVRCNMCHEHVSEQSIREHVDKMHGTHPYVCNLCGDVFIDPIDLQLHLCHHSRQEQMIAAGLQPEDLPLRGTVTPAGQSGDTGKALSGEDVVAMADVSQDGSATCSEKEDVPCKSRETVSKKINWPFQRSRKTTPTKTSTKYSVETGRRLSARLKAKQSGADNASIDAIAGEDTTEANNSDDMEDDSHKVQDAMEGRDVKEVLSCRCGLCGAQFVNVNLLRRHVTAHYKERPFSCDMCAKKFSRQHDLVQHRLAHQDASGCLEKKKRKTFPMNRLGLYTCVTCKLEFNEYKKIYDHSLRCEKQEPKTGKSGVSRVTCDVCGLVVSGPRHLVRHKLVHSGERAWLCQQCGRSFLRRDDLQGHLRRHEKKTKMKIQIEDTGFSKACPFCKKMFTSLKALVSHLKTHKSDRLDGSYKCSECSKVFTKHISLRNHLQAHRDTYRRGMKRGTHLDQADVYLCIDCGKEIHSKSNFVRHMKIHNEGKHHACGHCNKCFVRLADLRNHERVHGGDKPFQCKTCGRRFLSNSSLVNHRKQHLELITYKYACVKCEEDFSSRAECQAHSKTCVLWTDAADGPGTAGPKVDSVIDSPAVDVIDVPRVGPVIEVPRVGPVIDVPRVDPVIDVLESEVVHFAGVESTQLKLQTVEIQASSSNQEVEVVYVMI